MASIIAQAMNHGNLVMLRTSDIPYHVLEATYQQYSDFAQRYKKPNTAKAVAAYVDLAEQHGLTPTQLSLAFVYQCW